MLTMDRPQAETRTRVGPIAWDGTQPLIMGILNITPDSFSNGGAFLGVDQAVAQAEAMVQAGASIIDIGGESTRPGADPVSADAEAARVLPVIDALTRRNLKAALSIDTYKARVAKAALQAGAHIVNDVTAMRDAGMAAVVADAGAVVILMHSQGDPQTMQQNPAYADVVADVCHALGHASRLAQQRGIAAERIWLDPGLGFGKTFEHNVALLKHLGQVSALGHPVVVGASRKRFLGTITGRDTPQERDTATAVVSALVAQAATAQVFRVHNVAATREAFAVVQAMA